MSDMEQSDVIEPAAAPEIAHVNAEPAEAPAEASEPTAEELQAEIDELKASIGTQNSAAVQEPEAEAPQPEPVVVIARTPSSESPTQQPEEDKPFSVEEAARVVVTLVRAHRTIGDADLDAAIAVLDAEYPAESEPEQA